MARIPGGIVCIVIGDLQLKPPPILFNGWGDSFVPGMCSFHGQEDGRHITGRPPVSDVGKTSGGGDSRGALHEVNRVWAGMVCETIRGTEQHCLSPRSTFIYRFYNRGDMARLPPTSRKLIFGGSTAGQPAVIPVGVIDIGQCLSLLNRRAYRQGMEYYVESWSLSSDVPCQASVETLTESWVNTNAWVKAFRTWMKSQEQLEEFDEIKGHYHDFKVFTDSLHAGAGMQDNLIPQGINFAAVALADPTATAAWDHSNIQIPNVDVAGTPTTVEYSLHMVGPDVPGSMTKGIVAGYAESRSRPQQNDPNVFVDPSWMDLAFDDGDNFQEIRDDIIYENDNPPYLMTSDGNFEFYPGGTHYLQGGGSGRIVQTTLNINPLVGSFTTKFGAGFVAPLGLVQVYGPVDVNFEITLNIAIGPYKGVMARPMQDVN